MAKPCPNCQHPIPRLRVPKTLHQLLWGGSTCAQCGTEVDRRGRVRS